MTDKQIIIDGVDVSECLFYQTNFEEDYDVKIKHYCSSWHNSCESNNNSNCYYKQLKRKEQECENYKKQFKADTKEMEDYQNEIARHLQSIEYWQHQAEAKEQECERLKEQLDCKCFDPKSNNNRCISYNRIAEDYERDLKQLDQLKEQLEAYKMEAEEGKEINAGLQAENESLENQLKSEKERFEKQDKFAAMYIQELKNEKSSLIKKFLEKIGQLQSENEELKKKLNQKTSDYDDLDSLGCHGLSDW